ncbi:hypothetical protein D3C72_1294770 [compost metagenome]
MSKSAIFPSDSAAYSVCSWTAPSLAAALDRAYQACTPRFPATGSPTLILKLLDLRLTWPLHCSGLFYLCNSVIAIIKVKAVQQPVSDGGQYQPNAGNKHQPDIQAISGKEQFAADTIGQDYRPYPTQ